MFSYRKSRSGFTLVELLVVLALMAILAAMTVTYFPSASNSQRESRAATLLQGWLNIAKQRAVRDQAPRGLRLISTQTQPVIVGGVTLAPVVTECVYLEQPDDFFGGTIQGIPPTPPSTLYNVIGFPASVPPTPSIDLLNGFSPIDPSQTALWAVQPGDSLEIFGTGLMYNIVSINSPTQITIDPPMPSLLQNPADTYRILRAPRALGDEPLTFPAGTLIDVGTNLQYGNPLPVGTTAGVVDVMFSPTGAVISPGVTTSNINLWVRAPSEAYPVNVFAGTPTIVSISVRTGFVGAYAVDSISSNPYSHVK